MVDNNTCNFCRSVYKTPKLSHVSFCEGCEKRKSMMEPRYKWIVAENCVNYAKGIFESFVAEQEKSITIFGIKTFNTLINESKQQAKYLSQLEYIEILTIINEFEHKYEQFIDMVINKNMYIDISSSGKPKRIKTPNDWTSAIMNLFRILALANQGVYGTLDKYLNSSAVATRRKSCKLAGYKNCSHPCVRKSSILGSTCTYEGSPFYHK